MEAVAGGRAMVLMMAAAAAAAAMMVASHIGGVGAQTQPDCASKLIPCLDAVTNTSIKPGKECCSNLAEAVKNQLSCLCTVYYKSGILGSFKINNTRALEIPRLCGVSNDLSHCSSAAPVPSSPSSGTPTLSPGSENKQGNGALKLTWPLKPLWALGLFWMALNMD